MTTQTTPADHDLAPPEARPGFGPVLRNRNFMLIWLAQGISQIAYHAVNFALVVMAETVTRSSTAVSLIILSFSLPAILFSGLAGVLVDRASKRRVMVVTTALRTLTLATLIAVDPDWPWPVLMSLLYLVTFVFSTLSQVFGPAEGALIPRLVGPRLLIAANSLFNLTFFASQLIGFAVVGPVLAKLVGLHTLFQIATGLYAICTLLVWLLPHDHAPAVPAQSARRTIAAVWAELVEGIQTIWRDRLMVKAIAYLSLASSAFLMLGAVGPAFVTRVLGIPAEDVGFIMAPAGLGVVLGIVAVNRLARAENRERMIDLAILVAGLALLVFAAVKPAVDRLFGLVDAVPPVPLVVGLVMIVASIVGGASSFILIPAQTVLQERSPDAMRARVYAAFYTVSSAVALGPVLFAGALSDLVGVTRVLVIIAVSFIAIGGLNLRRLRTKG